MKDMVVQGMTMGQGYPDYSDYKYNLGYIQALDRVLDAMQKVNDDIGKE